MTAAAAMMTAVPALLPRCARLRIGLPSESKRSVCPSGADGFFLNSISTSFCDKLRDAKTGEKYPVKQLFACGGTDDVWQDMIICGGLEYVVLMLQSFPG